MRKSYLLRFLGLWLPLSVLLTNCIYWIQRPHRGILSVDDVFKPHRVEPSLEDIFVNLFIAGILALVAGSIVGGVAALVKRGLNVGGIFCFWSAIGSFTGSISGGSIAYWRVVERTFGRVPGTGGFADIGAMLGVMEIWLCSVVVGVIWGCICATIHTAPNSSQ